VSGNHESANVAPPTLPQALTQTERLAYSVEETAELLGVHYFSVYRMIQRGKLCACRVAGHFGAIPCVVVARFVYWLTVSGTIFSATSAAGRNDQKRSASVLVTSAL
jgi:excisionase family DNA binding protein